MRKQDNMPARNKKNFRPTKKGAGMTKAGVAAYRRANPGSKLKTAVTGKVKKGSKDANRRKSYCARSAGQMKKFPKAAKIQRELKEAYQQIGDAMIAGSVDNMEKYKYMMGQAHAYYKISQDISNLLNKKEQNEKGTVIKFGEPKN